MCVLETAQKNRSEGLEIHDSGGVNTEGPWAAQRFKYMMKTPKGWEDTIWKHPQVEGEEERAAAVEIFQEWWKWGGGTRIY